MQLNVDDGLKPSILTLKRDDAVCKSSKDEGKDTENTNKRKLSGAWSFMSTPTTKDISGSRKVSKAFDTPKKTFDHLIVLDFEWTCDDAKFGPPEIIEFPSVLLSGNLSFDVGWQQFQQTKLRICYQKLLQVTTHSISPQKSSIMYAQKSTPSLQISARI
jgi:hypothetical protein